MSCKKFVDRRRELEGLDRAFARRPGMVIVYGRRRTGKTRLVREWLRRSRVRSVYYLSQLASHRFNLRLIARMAGEQLGLKGLAGMTPERLVDILTFLADADLEVLVLDEVTYWVRSDPVVLSELQEFVDLRLGETGMLVVLTGSLVGVMERDVLGAGSPLYARSTGRIHLKPLVFPCMREFFPGLDSVDRVRLYSIIGGLPFYACQAAGVGSLEEAVERLLVGEASLLAGEKELILREELREASTYNSILSAIANGRTTPGVIAEYTGLKPGHVAKALHTLTSLGLVSRIKPYRGRRGFYRIADPVLRTWYNLLEPVQHLIELGEDRRAMERILARLDVHSSPVWEEIVGWYLAKRYASRGFRLIQPFISGNVEIDAVLVNEEERKVVLAEAKWSSLSKGEAERIRRRAIAKAEIVFRGFDVEEAFVGVREVIGGGGDWLIVPSDVEAMGCG